MRDWGKVLIVVGLLVGVAGSRSAVGQMPQANARGIFQELLTEVDKDQDGKMSKEEFFAIWKDKNVAEKNYTSFDGDKDGFITEDEYVQGTSR